MKNVDAIAVQLAAWHLASGRSFRELGQKTDSLLAALMGMPDFTPQQIDAAENRVARAAELSAVSASHDDVEADAAAEAATAIQAASSPAVG